MRRCIFVFVLAAGAIACGCGTTPQPTTVFCSDYTVGGDLSGADFGVSGPVKVPYVALAQASSDIALVSGTMLEDVNAACESLTLDLGGTLPEVAPNALLSDRVTAACDAARKRIELTRQTLRSAHFSVTTTPDRCVIDVSYQTACEKKCQADAACHEAEATSRCPRADRAGVCDGTCRGTCSWSCHAGKPCKCDGLCSGECDGTTRDFTCSGELAPPVCAGDVDCQAACKASAAARATCTGGSLSVKVDEAAMAELRTAQIVASLGRNLPAIFLSSRAHGQLLSDDASALIDASGRMLTRLSTMEQKSAACGVLIVNTGAEASRNLHAVVSGSKAVTTAVEAVVSRKHPDDESVFDEVVPIVSKR